MTWQRSTLADFMGDRVVYRSLEPADPRVPGLRDSWEAAGLDHYHVPRKTSPQYAAVVMQCLEEAQRLRGMKPLERLLFIGDTFLNDGTAARNLGKHLPMRGFIGSDRLAEPAKTEIQGDLLVGNRWQALAEYVQWTRREGFVGDEHTALLVDLDKTSLGARGRNDSVIDGARVRAVQRTMQAALGDEFDEVAFRAVYDLLNQPEFHYFTADNQDYLAYVSLMAIGGVCPAEELWRDLEAGDLLSIMPFVERCEGRRDCMSPGLLAAQDEVWQGIQNQDPTPFKGFRRGEYFETLARMDLLPDDAAEDQVLSQEIVITAEVASVSRQFVEEGVLVFGISDKPDEASVPLPEDAALGYQPIHRAKMKVYGSLL